MLYYYANIISSSRDVNICCFYFFKQEVHEMSTRKDKGD